MANDETTMLRLASTVNILPPVPRLYSKVVSSSLSSQSPGQVSESSSLSHTEFPHVDQITVLFDGLEEGSLDGSGVGRLVVGLEEGLRLGFAVDGSGVGRLVVGIDEGLLDWALPSELQNLHRIYRIRY